MASIIRSLDSGIIFNITVQDESGIVNLTSAQLLQLFFQKPDKTVISRNCSTVNATLGKLRYVSSSTDFDQSGKWSVQLVVKLANGYIKHSAVGTIIVAPNISTI